MVKLPKTARFAILSLTAASMVIAFGTPIGDTSQQAYAAKSGVTVLYCYPDPFSEFIEFACFPNMGECHKAQEADSSTAGECFHEKFGGKGNDGEIG